MKSSSLTKKNWILFFATLLVIVLFFISMYFFLIRPKAATLEAKQTALETENSLLQTLEKQKVENTSAPENTANLQLKVPVDPLVEQLILDIEKAETLSNNTVTSIDFSDDDVTAEQEIDSNEVNSETEEIDPDDYNINYDINYDINTEENMEVMEEKQVLFPNGMKKITANLSVTAENYNNLKKFIDALEQGNRIIVVENISFSGQGEINDISQSENVIDFSVQLVAFYMPELQNLQDDLPNIDAPMPSNKIDPLNQFPLSADTFADTESNSNS